MTASPTPKSVKTTGNTRSVWIPGSSSNPLSVVVLAAVTSKDVTYSLTGGGMTPTINESSIPDSRFGARQVLNKQGNFTEEVSIEYLFGDTNDVAQPAMTEGTSGFLVLRLGIPNETDWAVGQKVFVWSADLGKQQLQPPAENALLTMKQGLFLNNPTQNLATTVA